MTMMMIVPGRKPFAAYVAAKTLNAKSVLIATTQMDYVFAERLARLLHQEGVRFHILQTDGEPEVLAKYSYTSVYCAEMSPLAVRAIQAAPKGTVYTSDGENVTVLNETRGTIRPRGKLSLETILALSEVDHRLKLNRSGTDPELAAAIAAAMQQQDDAIPFLKWAHGQGPLPEKLSQHEDALKKREPQWIRGGWLKDYVFAQIRDMEDLGDVAHSVEFSNRRVALEVAATLNYNLLAFACVAQANEDSPVFRAVATYQAAQRIAGDFARVAVVCLSRFSSEIEGRIAHLIGRAAIKVFGLQSLCELKSYIDFWTYNYGCQDDVEEVRQMNEQRNHLRFRPDND
jgi:hypothetical protein